IEVARRVWSSGAFFADGVYFVSLAELDTPDQLSFAMAEVLGLSVDIEQEIQHQIESFLRDKSILLVLDNFEHRLDAVGRVEQLLNAAPQVHVMTTSRERLHLRGEQLFHVHGLVYDDTAPLAQKERIAAVELFLQSARNIVFDLDVNT